MTGWYVGALALITEALMWRRHWKHQLQNGADAPTHFEAAAARGQLDAPFFGEYQPSGPGTYWAYVGPRAILLVYWLFVSLWRWRRPVCCVVWQFCMAACTMAAVGILWPEGMSLGLWCLPLVALVLWSSEDNGCLGASNPLALLVLALALRAGTPSGAGALFGLAVALRVWPLAWAPLVLYAQGWQAGADMLVCAVAAGGGVTLLARLAGFGYEPPTALWRLFRAIQTGPLSKLIALHKRRPYFIMLAPALMYPTLASVVGWCAVAYVAVVLNNRRWAAEGPHDVAGVWWQNWRGEEHRM